MNKELLGLLEELEKSFPKPANGQDIRKRYGVLLIIEAEKKGLIDVPHNMQDLKPKIEHNNTIPFILSDKGFLILYQTRLDNSIKNFDRSSQKTAWVMIWLSAVMAILSIITLIFTWMMWKG